MSEIPYTIQYFDYLVANDTGLSDRFGSSVDIYETTIVVGCTFYDTSLSNTGAAFVFDYKSSSDKWYQTQRLLPDGLVGNTELGVDVAIHNNVINIALGSLVQFIFITKTRH